MKNTQGLEDNAKAQAGLYRFMNAQCGVEIWGLLLWRPNGMNLYLEHSGVYVLQLPV